MPKLLILAVFFVSGCSSVTTGVRYPEKPKIFSERVSHLRCKIEGANDFEKEFIAETLSIMPGGVQQAIDRIVVHKEKTADFKDVAAYCEHIGGKNEIHILREKLSRSILWHEAAHAYDFSLCVDDDA